MILKTDSLKDLAQTILPAVESTDISSLPETLELISDNGTLNFNVTNREYFLNVKLSVTSNESFHATINAILFLKLISQLTTETVDLSTDDTSLIIKSNGVYKLALIFDGDKMLELPKIDIENIQETFSIEGNTLFSILKYNTKQISTGILSRPVQKMYYVDSEGAITFTSGACVNCFSKPLEKSVSFLFNQRLVKLFKLFRNTNVEFTLGQSDQSNEFVQTKVSFKSDNIVLTAILNSDPSLLNSVPVKAIRSRANFNYPYSVSINTNLLNDCISRMKLFVSQDRAMIPYIKLLFKTDSILLSDLEERSFEKINYSNDDLLDMDDYTLVIDLNELQGVLDTCIESVITFSFGDSQALVISHGIIKNVIPEVRLN